MLQKSISRRTLLRAGLGAGAVLGLNGLPLKPLAAATHYQLRAKPSQIKLVGESYPATDVWSYNGSVPGSEIRIRQGERLRVVVNNELEQDTSVHWHGIRLPNAMDGVPGLTQDPIKPGQQFVYEFEVPDAGTYWYHPHVRSSEQIGRGLYGPLIVEEPEPIAVDRDITWVLDDWRLTQEAQIDPVFGRMNDMTHAGRIGNTVSVNGVVPETFSVRAGERIRLRLINVANARNFGLKLQGHSPKIIATDGQPVEPYEPEDGLLLLGAAMRLDVVIDMSSRPGHRFELIDTFYLKRAYKLLDVVYSDAPALRDKAPETSIQLPPNPLPEPNIAQAERHEIIFAGGAMGGMRSAMLNGQMTDIRTLVQQHSVVWAINGIAMTDPLAKPLLTLKRDRSYILSMRNDTAFAHPIHLHGYSFRVIARNGQSLARRLWQDTVLMAPREQVDIAFVADNPGDWMFHCHILEHMEAGMMGVIQVA